MGEDEAGTRRADRSTFRELIEPKAVQYRGRIIKGTGDGALIEFGSAVDAVSFAVEVQCAMRERNRDVPESRQTLLRIQDLGIDMSDEVEIESEKTAGRIETLAPLWWLWGPLVLALALAIIGNLNVNWYRRWILGEHGALEIGQVVLALAGLMVALKLLMMPQLRGRPWFTLWVGFAAAASLYIAGEEASWGQHYFGWPTPDAWTALNDQNETNLHNVSSWFDQKPRRALETGVIAGGILIPLLALAFPALRRNRFGLILPPLLCLPTALIAESIRFLERGLRSLGDGFDPYIRSSELQEFYFYLFILLYLIVLRRRIRGLGAGKRQVREASQQHRGEVQ